MQPYSTREKLPFARRLTTSHRLRPSDTPRLATRPAAARRAGISHTPGFETSRPSFIRPIRGLFCQMAKPTLSVVCVFDRLHALADLQRAERVEHHGQLVGPFLA